MDPRISAAIANAALATRAAASAPSPAPQFEETLALGDAQATTEKLFEVLAAHDLLSSAGWLRPEARLVCVGDYFDFGSFAGRIQAQEAGLRNLAWLAAHSPAQIVLLIGNHDLARVGELLQFDDATFDRAATEANALYVERGRHNAQHWQALDAAFCQRWPSLPSVEVGARDFSGFHTAQRNLVLALLRQGRLTLAWSNPNALVSHAGVTSSTLFQLGLSSSEQQDPVAIALALNTQLRTALAAWAGDTPFRIPDVHQPGSGTTGEGFGILFHRPAHPINIPQAVEAERSRRFDPRSLPPRVTQVIGHIRDPKCRTLLAPWVTDTAGPEGRLRSLVVSGSDVTYGFGVQAASTTDARIVFVDGGLNSAPSTHYELLSLDTLQARQSP